MNNQEQNEQQPKKMSLQEAIKLKLESKKQQASGNNSASGISQKTKKLTSQQSKKPSNTRRKMGV
ncbi:hypothetical protein D0469_10300 [Peribacillus saganii]|uniref:Uncharacterized protein n=1 Tax=Peribacillus saganii TaxID=2303992 RepID=A0A372LQI2_9BACI|nr:hypothetical protein [Peribacillus saganii]RFU69136.1 hypothetical protein D0469_10300 [Peribacillus saganii]